MTFIFAAKYSSCLFCTIDHCKCTIRMTLKCFSKYVPSKLFFPMHTLHYPIPCLMFSLLPLQIYSRHLDFFPPLHALILSFLVSFFCFSATPPILFVFSLIADSHPYIKGSCHILLRSITFLQH